jgi:hypothetical protein
MSGFKAGFSKPTGTAALELLVPPKPDGFYSLNKPLQGMDFMRVHTPNKRHRIQMP